MTEEMQIPVSTVTTTAMKTKRPEPELSFPQLLDALEKRVDTIIGTPSGQMDTTMLKQVDDAISRIPDIWGKAKNTKNSLVPINKLPPKTLAQVAAFLDPGGQLIDATAVCQHWRATLLSFPWLWNTITCSNLMQFEAYLERSKSVPLIVRFNDLDPCLFKALVPHTSRLAILGVRVECSSDLSRVVRYLRNPPPMLYRFIITSSYFEADALKLSSGVGDGYFMHVKALQLEDISSFRSPLTFPHVTKLTWYVSPCLRHQIRLPELLDTLQQFPVLEVIYLVFQAKQQIMTVWSPHTVTLPHVQRMNMFCSGDWGVGISPILQFLKLPNLTSLSMDMVPELPSPFAILPVTSFGEHLPNLAELPEMEVHMGAETGRVRFRSPSQAVLNCWSMAQPLEDIAYHHHRVRWGGLPLHSVRRLTVTLHCETVDGAEALWVIGLLCDLGSLEHLELVGYCGCVLRCLRRLLLRGDILSGIKTLTVCSGTYDLRQATRLKDVTDDLGLGIVVTCTPAPDMPDTDEWSSDGGSEDWDLGADDEDEDEDGNNSKGTD